MVITLLPFNNLSKHIEHNYMQESAELQKGFIVWVNTGPKHGQSVFVNIIKSLVFGIIQDQNISSLGLGIRKVSALGRTGDHYW